MKKVFVTAVLGVVILCTSASWGTCHVITPAGSGTLSGADWNNACKGFSGSCSGSSMVRGDAYYLAQGSYSSPTLSTAASGTTLISIKAATAADHCTDTGFNQSTQVGQAVLSGALTPTTDYWTIDGQYGTEVVGKGKGTYGIKIQTSGGSDEIHCTGGCGNSTFRYLELQGANYSNCTSAQYGLFIYGASHSGGAVPNVTMQHVYEYQDNGIWHVNQADNMLLENSISAENYSSGSCHGENIGLTNISTATVIRYNRFVNCAGTACIADPNAVSETSTNVQIYGNVFYNDMTHGPCENRGGTGPCLDNGIITVLGGGNYVGLKIYNNTIANWIQQYDQGNTLDLFANFSGGAASNVEIRNNLFYNNEQTDASGATGGGCSSNSFYATTLTSSACSGDITGKTTNPFVNTATTPQDFHLTTDTAAWTALSGPYNVDPDGVTRSSSRGAYQYTGVTAQRPNPPTALTVTIQ